MTNITEAKRMRDQLSASHERFTTVLEGLDAAVSVLSVQQGELLFANRSYRPLVRRLTRCGHALLAGGVGGRTITSRARRRRSTVCPGLPTHELTEAGTEPARGLTSSRCRSGSTCARATCSGPTAGWRRC